MNALARSKFPGLVFPFAPLGPAAGFGFRVDFAMLFHAVVMIAERL